MSRKPTPPVTAKDLQGFKYFARVSPLLERLHHSGTASDKAGNRRLFFDQYAALLLLYFFNPILTSFNGLQQASALDKVQKITGGPRVSKGSLSESAKAFLTPPCCRDSLPTWPNKSPPSPHRRSGPL